MLFTAVRIRAITAWSVKCWLTDKSDHQITDDTVCSATLTFSAPWLKDLMCLFTNMRRSAGSLCGKCQILKVHVEAGQRSCSVRQQSGGGGGGLHVECQSLEFACLQPRASRLLRSHDGNTTRGDAWHQRQRTELRNISHSSFKRLTAFESDYRIKFV